MQKAANQGVTEYLEGAKPVLGTASPYGTSPGIREVSEGQALSRGGAGRRWSKWTLIWGGPLFGIPLLTGSDGLSHEEDTCQPNFLILFALASAMALLLAACSVPFIGSDSE